MKRIRIGNTIHLSYSLYKKSVEGKEPEDLTGIDVNVSLMNKLYNEILDAPVVVSGNVISMSIPGDIQKITGVYNLFVSYKKGEEDCAIDVDAFQLVDSSSKVDGESPHQCPEIRVETVELEGVVDYYSLSGGGPVDWSDITGKPKFATVATSGNYDDLSNKPVVDVNKAYVDGELKKKADKTSVYTRQEVDNKILASSSLVTTDEQQVGILRYGGKDYTIYELTIKLTDLPILAGESVDVILSDSPVGDNLYLKVDCLSVSSGDGFPISAYSVKKIFTDEKMNTVATIVCSEAVTADPKALLTIRYVKGLLSFDTFELSIPVSELGITSADDITVKMPSLKYDKKFALSWTTDDSLLCIYSLIHKYINKKYIDDEYNFHDGMTPTTGITPTRVLCSTDGCGNDVRFRVDSGWVSYNNNMSDGIHSDSYPYNYVRWSEMITFLDFLNTAMNHGGGDQTKPLESIEMCGNRLFEKTDYLPFLLLVPGGTNGYQNTAETLDYIYHYHDKNNLNYSTDGLTKESFVQKHGLLGRKTYDGMTYEQLCAYIDTQAVRSDHPYTYLGGHVIADANEQIKWTDAVKPFLDYLYDTYGRGGNDSIWFAGPEEVYEYLFTRAYSIINKEIINGNLVIKVKVARLPLFKKLEYSLLLSKTDSLQTVPSLSIDHNVIKLSTGLKDGMLLVNVNYNKELLNLAEKYTAKYEASGSDIDQEDGLYFAGMLRYELAEPYLQRLNAEVTTPILNSININFGDMTTFDANVVVNFDVTGAFTHYRIGEVSDMSGITWIAGSSKNQNYILSSGIGSKIIYAQVKNAVGVSMIRSATIELQERPIVKYTVTGQSNNADYGIVLPAEQEVSEGDTAYLTATANDGYLIENWDGATSSTGAGEKSGTATIMNVQSDKTVTCNFKQGPVTPPEPAGTKIIIFPFTFNQDVTLPNGDKASQVRAAFSTTSITDDIVDTLGNIIGKKVLSQASLPDGVLNMASSDNTNPVLSGNTGVYPDEYIKKMYGIYDKGVYPASRGVVRLIEMAQGTYTVRILYSTQKELSAVQIAGLTYEANNVLVNPPSGYSPLNNNNQFIEINDVAIGSDGILDIYMGNTQEWVRSGWNAIEIEKIE